jgi:hypothetical protein
MEDGLGRQGPAAAHPVGPFRRWEGPAVETADSTDAIQATALPPLLRPADLGKFICVGAFDLVVFALNF